MMTCGSRRRRASGRFTTLLPRRAGCARLLDVCQTPQHCTAPSYACSSGRARAVTTSPTMTNPVVVVVASDVKQEKGRAVQCAASAEAGDGDCGFFLLPAVVLILVRVCPAAGRRPPSERKRSTSAVDGARSASERKWRLNAASILPANRHQDAGGAFEQPRLALEGGKSSKSRHSNGGLR